MTDELKEANVTETSDTLGEAHPSSSLGDSGMLAMQGIALDDNEHLKEKPRNVSDWADHGIVEVPVADLPWPEDINGVEDFNHNITYEDAVTATRRLQEMKPLIKQGYTGDDFSRMDQDQGLEWANGHRRIYDLFYGGSPIKVSKEDNHYEISGGRHRIYMAKELGLNTIPARLKERVE